MRFHKYGFGAGAVTLALVLGACSSTPQESSTPEVAPIVEEVFEAPSQVTAVVHTGAGGGGDLLAREVISMLEKEGLIEANSWIVENAEGGSSAVALAAMANYEGRDDVVAFISNIWMTNQLLTEGIEFGTLDFTPVASLVQDTYVVTVAADSPYETLADLIDAAGAANGTFVQAGGSPQAIDSQVGLILQGQAGAEWQLLPFAKGGERKTALIRGDAQFWITEAGDVREEVAAGTFRVIATIGDERSSAYPDVETTSELGYTDEQPVMIRGVLAPAGISAGALDYYAGLFADLQETASWGAYTERNANQTLKNGPIEYKEMLVSQRAGFEIFYDSLGLLIK